ncbi:MAG: YhjD/YihY/BrkB family envelope integrity protein [Sciscionella sp.]
MTARPEGSSAAAGAPESTGKARAVFVRTLVKAWHGSIFSEAAEAAFWQTLSLPPLLLGLLGCVGFVGDWFGRGVVDAVQQNILRVTGKVFSSNVVDTIIAPTVSDILRTAQGEIASVGFLISLWAGSSAMSSFVDAITVAHDQYGVRNEVWQRIYALLLYLGGLIVMVVVLPLLAVGPNALPDFFPLAWRSVVRTVVTIAYYPSLALLIMVALATLYKVALPRKLPWHRGLPGAALAMIVFICASIGLRIYISNITKTGYTYGALAAPIAFLLLTFFIGLAIVGGAHLNAAIQEIVPAGLTNRQRRRWRRLEMERTGASLRRQDEHDSWRQPTTVQPSGTDAREGSGAGIPAEEGRVAEQREGAPDQPTPRRVSAAEHGSNTPAVTAEDDRVNGDSPRTGDANGRGPVPPSQPAAGPPEVVDAPQQEVPTDYATSSMQRPPHRAR